METLFEQIISNLKAGNSISSITKEIKLELAKGTSNISDVMVRFIEYLNSNYHNMNNSQTFEIIGKCLKGDFSLDKMANELFLKKIIIDQEKRDGGAPQFRHNPDEAFLDKIFRTIYEFTRGDILYPKGVCFDFCLFIYGLSTAKRDKSRFYIWNSIENETKENNYVLFRVDENNNCMVYDPFNGIYLPPEKYDIASYGATLVELNIENNLKEDPALTGFLDGIISYSDILAKLNLSNKKNNEDAAFLEELKLLKRQNYYARLGVRRDATPDQIKAAYREKQKNYHPDLHPNDKYAIEKSQLINEAYEKLSDEASRKEYDQEIAEDVPSARQDSPNSPIVTPKQPAKPVEINPQAVLESLFKLYGVTSFEELQAILEAKYADPNIIPISSDISTNIRTIISQNNTLKYKYPNNMYKDIIPNTAEKPTGRGHKHY